VIYFKNSPNLAASTAEDGINIRCTSTGSLLKKECTKKIYVFGG
jgi:hypothetical protein